MPSLAPLAVAAAALLAVANAANCTTTEVAAIAKLDSVVESAPECARLNSLVAGEATLLQICSDSACIAIVKKAATQAPDCLVNGESAKRVSLTAFTSCAAPDSSSNSTTNAPTPTTTPAATTKAPSTSAGSVGGDSDAKASATVATPAPTTAAPKSGAAAMTTSTVAITSAAVLLYAAWM